MNKEYKTVPKKLPNIGANTGIQKKPLAAEKVFDPQPAIAVNIRGAKSRAGFTAKPQLKPKLAPMTMRERPMSTAMTS